MEQYYAKQASLSHLSGHYRQRSCGFGALTADIGRVAMPFAQRVILSASKKLRRELLMSAAPELIEVAMKKKSTKQAIQNTVTGTARKELGGIRRRRKQPKWITKTKVSRSSKKENNHLKKKETSEKSSRNTMQSNASE